MAEVMNQKVEATPRNKFKKFGGERIPDVIEYIKDYIKENPKVTISLGCDSVQRRRKTIYSCNSC